MATILVVDDDPAVLRLAAIVLERAGHRTMRASSGVEALMVYESYAARLDLVLTDVRMPGMDGVELANRIRSAHPSARIVLMSGFLPPEVLRAAGAYPLLRKPFQPATLLETIEAALQ